MHISSGFRFQPDICKFFLFWFYLFVFHWRLITLQCCVRSCCTTAWNSCQWQVWIVSWVSAVFKAFSVLLRCVLWFATQWPVWERAVLTYHLSLVRVPVCCRGSVPCVCGLGWDQGFMTSSSVPSPSVILILWLESWGFRVCALLSVPMIGPVSGNKPCVDQEMGLPHPLGTWVSLIRDEGSPYSDFWFLWIPVSAACFRYHRNA